MKPGRCRLVQFFRLIQYRFFTISPAFLSHLYETPLLSQYVHNGENKIA